MSQTQRKRKTRWPPIRTMHHDTSIRWTIIRFSSMRETLDMSTETATLYVGGGAVNPTDAFPEMCTTGSDDIWRPAIAWRSPPIRQLEHQRSYPTVIQT